ncbi:MAG: 1-acyl-sn-glycerol-3-phosphate acyltransferase [Actinomycetota bacterium]
MFDPMFVPPREHPLIMRIANATLPFLAQSMGNIRDFHVTPADFSRLQDLGPDRAILSPNHPTGLDPFAMFWLSRKLGQPFNYLAAREVLDGVKGWMMNRVGTYSVIRGVADRESIRTTRRLLAEQDRKVVIFPEGEIYEHNDRLLAFQSGVAQIGFWVLDDLEKQGKSLKMPILPVAIKYRCCDSPRLAIENSLTALEKALDPPPSAGLTAYLRLRRVGNQVLAAMERDVGLPTGDAEALDERIRLIRRKTLERVASRIGVQLNESQAPADQLHLLFHELKSWVGVLGEEANDYDERLYQKRIQEAAPLFNELQRLQNFIAMTGDYVAAEATAERFLDVLGRLEKEVFGSVRHNVPREARLRIAPPIRLEERYAEYRQSKRQVVSQVTTQLETTIRELLQQLSSEATPIALNA